MTTATTTVFKSGNSQAIRLPKAFRLRSRTVTLVHTDQGILISDAGEDKRRARAFAKLAGSCPDFPEIRPVTAKDLPRDF